MREFKTTMMIDCNTKNKQKFGCIYLYIDFPSVDETSGSNMSNSSNSNFKSSHIYSKPKKPLSSWQTLFMPPWFPIGISLSRVDFQVQDQGSEDEDMEVADGMKLQPFEVHSRKRLLFWCWKNEHLPGVQAVHFHVCFSQGKFTVSCSSHYYPLFIGSRPPPKKVHKLQPVSARIKSQQVMGRLITLPQDHMINKMHSNEKWTLGRCISYWKWGYSIAMFVCQRVIARSISQILIFV